MVRVNAVSYKNWRECYKIFNGEFTADIDYGVELFVNGSFSEIETLSPLAKLKPGEEVIHTEKWRLLRSECLENNRSESFGEWLALI